MIASESSVGELHEILRLAFDWSGEHLHRFRIRGRDYGTAQLGGLIFDEDARKVPLARGDRKVIKPRGLGLCGAPRNLGIRRCAWSSAKR